jgi:transposase-like protein
MKNMNEKSCLTKVLILCRGRGDGWITREDPPRMMRPVCPRCQEVEVKVHRSHRKPILDYRCPSCRKVFNCLSGTVFQGTHRTPSELVKLIIGVVKKMSSVRLARINSWQRAWLVSVRRRLEELPWIKALREDGENAKRQSNGLRLRDLGAELGDVFDSHKKWETAEEEAEE